jgi:serine/threonine protein kinase
LSTGEASQLAGSTIGGYELLELIGKGGMGTVYRAKSRTGQIVAVKVLAEHLTTNDVLRTRFYLEAKLAMSLEHPNIVRAIDVGEDNGRHFLAMEYIDGESVSSRLQRGGPMPEGEAIAVAAAVARALYKAHSEGLVHRDVKPDNIMISSRGIAKLTDLGLAKKAETDLDLTRTGKGLGTPHFMAPEQFRNAKYVDARSDIYALGATFYVMVTGKLPFRGDGPLDTFIKKSKNIYTPVEELNPHLSQRTLKVIQAAMSADPLKRPATAEAFADFLEGKSKQLTVGEVPESSIKSVDVTWYIKLDSKSGSRSRLRGPESTIKMYIQKGKIGPSALASSQKGGPFQPISEIAEFQDCLRESMSNSQRMASLASLSSSTIRRPSPAKSSSSSMFGLDQPAFWITLAIGFVVIGIAAWILLGQK